MNDVQEGGCHCGALRYRLEGDLTDVAHCHCSICRRASGGLVVTWLTLPRKGFQWMAGEPKRYVAPASCTRFFCGDCGAHVALETTHSPLSIDVTVGTLDRPEQVRASRHIWTGSRLPWLHLDEELPGEVEESP
ncbi:MULTISPECIES: GFA family protein [Pseudomonas]|uniref:GFA family protein n=1 Tax=Pseudomonas TaxID=286 RepID=UPI00129A642C|nr:MULTISPECIES: GFA family protein [Pseudomonas]MBH3462883.1 GFA family protein [Pseudomonas putida]MBK0061838.1 GFA family protein [Pseudomonas sp. S44]HEK1688134.1 GFA family protein [Pseudomonas putida]